MPNYTPPPPTLTEMETAVSAMVLLWQQVAKNSTEIAHAKRTMFNAYIAEGFTEAQAIELVKQP